jgi:hypothetical protein
MIQKAVFRILRIIIEKLSIIIGFLPTQAEISRIGWIQPGHATRCHKKNISSNSVEPAGFNRVEVELTLYRRTRWNGSPVLQIRLPTRVTFSAVVATSHKILFLHMAAQKRQSTSTKTAINTKQTHQSCPRQVHLMMSAILTCGILLLRVGGLQLRLRMRLLRSWMGN